MTTKKTEIFLALLMQPGTVISGGIQQKINLPEGCVGIFLAFESRDSAAEWHGEEVKTLTLDVIEKQEPSE